MRSELIWGLEARPSSSQVAELPPVAGAIGTVDPVVGQVAFEETCTARHGIEGVGTDVGPPLVHPHDRPGHHADAAFALAVRNGVEPYHWNFGPM